MGKMEMQRKAKNFNLSGRRNPFLLLLLLFRAASSWQKLSLATGCVCVGASETRGRRKGREREEASCCAGDEGEERRRKRKKEIKKRVCVCGGQRNTNLNEGKDLS
jgi:hypothetical protein